jgi:hypothetical protein
MLYVILTQLWLFKMCSWPVVGFHPSVEYTAGVYYWYITLSRRLGARRRSYQNKQGNQTMRLDNVHLVVGAYVWGQLNSPRYMSTPRIAEVEPPTLRLFRKREALRFTWITLISYIWFNTAYGSLTNLRLLWQSAFGFLQLRHLTS